MSTALAIPKVALEVPMSVKAMPAKAANENAASPAAPDQLWQAVIAHDGRLDGVFYYGVRSTGVYCRPSCPSRRPLRQNVRFYFETAAAEQAGLRACRRCR